MKPRAITCPVALLLVLTLLTGFGCSSSTPLRRNALPSLMNDASETGRLRHGTDVTLILHDQTRLKGRLVAISCSPETTLVLAKENASSVDPFAGPPDTVSVPLSNVQRIKRHSTPGGAVIAAGIFVSVIVVAIVVKPGGSRFHPD